MKKLGIVLPTYNRSKYALEGIQALLPQLLHNSDRTCLLISDNASTDDTEEVLKPFAEKYPDLIRYVKQSENIGPHANFYFGIKNIDAEYVYLLGDDDLVSPNFIDTIMMLLFNNPGVGMLHFNYLEGPEDLQVIKNHHKRIFNNSLVRKYFDGKQFVKEFLIAPSFISSNVFLRDSMIKGLDANYHEDVYGYDWLVCLYTGILDKQCLYYDLPLVVQRYGSLYPRYALNTILGQQRVFEYLESYIKGISDEWKNNVARQNNLNIISVIETVFSNRRFYKKYYSDMNRCLENPIHKFCLCLATYVPKLIAIPLFKVISVINKILRLKNKKRL